MSLELLFADEACAALMSDEKLLGAMARFEGALARASARHGLVPAGLGALLDRSAWAVPPLFRFLEEAGNVSEEEMYRVFNMGIGMCLVVAPEAAERIADACRGHGDRPASIGRVVTGEGVAWA